MARIAAKSDFPSLTSAVTRIQRIAASDTESVASLAGEILQDVALTQKLLRMVNTVHFRRSGGSDISTVSRAVALVGFAGIRNMALSLLLLERMQNKVQAERLREEFVRALVAAQLARELTPGDSDAEEAYLAGLFYNLGCLLAEFYLPEEALAIRQLCQQAEPAVAAGAAAAGAAALWSPEAASRRVLGLGFEALGVAVAKSWGLPKNLRAALRRPLGAAPTRPLARGAERHRWLAAMAHDMALAMQLPDADAGRRLLLVQAERHARALDLTPKAICEAAEQARQAVAELAPAMGLPVLPGSSTHRLLSFDNAAAGVPVPADELVASAADAGQTAPVLGGITAQKQGNEKNPPSATRDAAAQMLAAGIQDVMGTLSSDHFQLNVVLRMVLETLLRALHPKRVVFCLRDARTQHITGRFGLGHDVDAVLRRFDIHGQPTAGKAIDLFSAVCLKAVDTVIADAEVASIRQRLPAWYGPDMASRSFLLLPLVMKGATFGLIYADAENAGGLVLPECEMALVRTLRNQAVMAFRQAA